jgi:hypothetical protein
MDKISGTILILIMPGIFLILFGVHLLRGGRKDIYMATHIFAGRIYAVIPWGIVLLMWAAGGLLSESPDVQWFFFEVGLGFAALGGIFYIFQPSFLKPAWLKWLEREHGDIMPILQQEANAMESGVWEERVKTQAGLEAWVAEVRRKHGLEKH